MRSSQAFILLVAIASFCLVTHADAHRRKVMPWMCLERCNSTTAEVHEHLLQILAHRDIIDAVSFELFNLGENGTLVRNTGLSNVAPALQAELFETFPMISSYPYPPQFIDWMRVLFNNSIEGDKFIEQCIIATVEGGFTGLNVDWEPTADATPEDAREYAQYLDTFAQRMHRAGKMLTVDIASWNGIWNFTEIGLTHVDRAITMSTYTNNITAFHNGLSKAVNLIPKNRLGVGISTYNLANNQPFSVEEIKERFDAVEAADVEQVDLWVAPIPDTFWPFLKQFVSRP